jgi:ASC-1-like (ASCH) protein
MKVTLSEPEKREVKPGDVLEFEDTHGELSYYMINHIEEEGYFITNLTGVKNRLRTYKTLRNLMNHQHNVNNIYSSEEYQLVLQKINQ